MINSLTNNMTSTLINYNSEYKNDNVLYQVDIKTIVTNAKRDKRFNKLLKLCINYGIQLFNQYNEICTLYDINSLISDTYTKQKILTLEMAKRIEKTSNIYDGDMEHIDILVEIDNIYSEYKKKFKDIEIILYDLKNIYNDNILTNLCCIKSNNSSSSQDNELNNNILSLNISNSISQVEQKKQKKYIATYSN
jgi:hypothetical protein